MRTALAALLLMLAVSPVEVSAQVFKCKEADGTLTYSQTPCSEDPEPEVAAPPPEEPAEQLDCTHAHTFAFETARSMQSGITSAEVFQAYGGVDALSRGVIGIVNYVYSFRTSEQVSAERIASLTEVKCQAQALGDVSCETLPRQFTKRFGGCNAEVESSTQQAAYAVQGDGTFDTPVATPTAATVAGRPTSIAADKEAVEQCKKRYRDQIDAIDAEMRRGYSSEKGEVYRERLRGLTEKLRAC